MNMSQVLCPVLANKHNNLITKDNVNSLLPSTYARTPGTRVTISCYVPVSYTLKGPSQLVCGTNGQWSPGVPTCIRRSGSGTNTNSGDGTTEDNNISSTEADDESILSDYSIIVIAVAAAFVAILIIILLVFLCKQFGSRGNNDDGLKEPIAIQYHDTESPPRPNVAVVKVDNMFSSRLQDVYTGPMSAPSWHSHPIIVMADKYKARTWSELSVDQYLREMDTSRRENPNHSWRDFTFTLSSYYSRSVNSSII